MTVSHRLSLILPLLTILWAGAARAEDPPALVGRLAYLEGTVSFHAADQTDWAYAAVNYPVTTGESFWSQPDGRSEIEIGSSVVRMDNATELDVLHLDAATIQLQLDQGALNYRLVQLAPNQTIEIETPHGAVALTTPGTYHIEAGDDTHPTLVAALEGTARFIGPESYLDITAGEQATAIGNPVAYTMAAAETTPFDDWALQRDERERQPEAVQYVAADMTGAQDLDHYGSWQTVPQYGQVWTPTAVPAEWAPYHAGHWAWVAPWGWTWVDDQPWGFAPFHYGRWAQINQRWGWIPGPVAPHAVYAPALVAFIGGTIAPGVQAGVEIGAGGVSLAGSIGWLPLGPNEVYYPPYRPSLGYVRSINNGPVNQGVINHITNNYYNERRTVNNYANAPAATVVPQQAFVNAQPVQTSAQHPQAENLRQATVNGNIAALQPTAFARHAARPAQATARTAAEAPGPTAAQQQQATQAVAHAEPGSLSTAGKTTGEPARPTVEPNREAAATRPEEHKMPEAAPANENHPEPVARHEEPVPQHETAPGPAIQVRPAVPLRRPVLEASLAPKPAPKPAPAKPQAPPPPRRQPQPAAVQPAAFHPAEVEHPRQAAPLRPTPQGWNRQAEARPENKDEKDKHEERH